ncbi:S8 family serine peptidase [Microbacterium sp. 18062]|uniref:S8 family peptidase n=1 Tax=Microbacterium sp. 18062 TaxID=2681410 RepID=UPI00135B50B1|nr:S8 family serine peptidase [Microbacterium sp. 18062]
MVSAGHHARIRLTTRLSATVGALGLVLLTASPAVAATAEDDGQWWYGAYGVEQVHAEGWTGKGVKIAVIDSQINPDLPVFQGADLTIAPGSGCAGSEPTTDQVTDNARHGSTVTALLIGNGTGAGAIRGIVPEASVTYYGLGSLSDCTETAEAEEAGLSAKVWLIKRALDDGADIISISQGGGNTTYEDGSVIAEAIVRKVPIVAAVQNDTDQGAFIPSSYRGVVAVNGVDRDRQFLTDSWGLPNAQLETTVVAPGIPFSSIGAPDGTWDDSGLSGGSSLATPLVAGILVATAQKYPDATGNQLIQSLIHNTGTEDHELEYDPEDGYGYGVASLNHVLSKDPTVYDDANPLLDKTVYPIPDQEQLDAAEAALATATPEPSETVSDPPAADAGSGILTVVIAVAVVILIVVVAAVVLTIVLVRRSHRQNREAQP